MRNYFTKSSNFIFPSNLYLRTGWLVLLVLLLFAALFWQERAVCMDVAFQAFWLINEGTFQVQVNRFGVVLVQCLPLLAIKLGLSVKAILFVYSLSFVLLQLVFYYLIAKVLKNEYLALAFVFLFTAQVSGAFYWTISEYQQALGLLLVFFAFVLKQKESGAISFFAFAIPLIITLVFYHPLIFFLFAFLWSFFFLHFESLRKGRYYVVLGIMLGTWLVKSVFFKNWYDNAKQRYLLENLENYFPNYLALDSNMQFLEHCMQTFFFFPILFCGLIFFYFKNRKWLKAILIIGASFTYLFFVNITHATGAEYFYIESFYFPMTLFVVVPIIFELANNWAMRLKVQIGILVFLVFRLFMIGFGHEYFAERLGKVEKLVQLAEQYPNQKVMVTEKVLGERALEMNWAVPFETLFYSTLHGSEKQQSLFVYTNLHTRQKEKINSDKVLLYMDKFFEYDKLNSDYFELEEEVYFIIND